MITLKYRINGALFRPRFDDRKAAQIRAAVLRENGIEVKFIESRQPRAKRAP